VAGQPQIVYLVPDRLNENAPLHLDTATEGLLGVCQLENLTCKLLEVLLLEGCKAVVRHMTVLVNSPFVRGGFRTNWLRMRGLTSRREVQRLNLGKRRFRFRHLGENTARLRSLILYSFEGW
jgi:hypothetical protein